MFEGQVAIVTGAGRGIGRAVAARLSRAGAAVVCAARTASELDSLVQDLRAAGGRAISVTGDVTVPDDVQRLVDLSLKEFGRIDVLVNNAGTVLPSPLVDMSFELWRSTLAVNLDSVYLTCHAVAPHMIAARRGRIINVASISGVRGSQKFPGFTAYAAAKAGVIVFTEALAAELREHGIRVNAISPGSVDTPLLRSVAPDLEAGMSAEEVAEAIAFLAGDGSRPVNGANLEIFG